MPKITVDSTIERLLRSTDERAELVDQYGNVLGYYDPKPGRIPQVALDACPDSDEELARSAQQARLEGGRSLKEILAELPQE